MFVFFWQGVHRPITSPSFLSEFLSFSLPTMIIAIVVGWLFKDFLSWIYNMIYFKSFKSYYCSPNMPILHKTFTQCVWTSSTFESSTKSNGSCLPDVVILIILVRIWVWYRSVGLWVWGMFQPNPKKKCPSALWWRGWLRYCWSSVNHRIKPARSEQLLFGYSFSPTERPQLPDNFFCGRG